MSIYKRRDWLRNETISLSNIVAVKSEAYLVEPKTTMNSTMWNWMKNWMKRRMKKGQSKETALSTKEKEWKRPVHHFDCISFYRNLRRNGQSFHAMIFNQRHKQMTAALFNRATKKMDKERSLRQASLLYNPISTYDLLIALQYLSSYLHSWKAQGGAWLAQFICGSFIRVETNQKEVQHPLSNSPVFLRPFVYSLLHSYIDWYVCEMEGKKCLDAAVTFFHRVSVTVTSSMSSTPKISASINRKQTSDSAHCNSHCCTIRFHLISTWSD